MCLRKYLILGLLVIGLLAAAPAFAQTYDTLPFGPKIGDNFANTLNNVDQAGVTRDFKSISQGKGVILMFNRSYFW